MDSNYGWALEQLVRIHEEKGEFLEAIETFEKAAVAQGTDSAKAAQKCNDLRRAFSTGGARGYWQKKLPHFFWRIHDNCIVNSHQIDDFVSSECHMVIHNHILHIARRRLKETLSKFKASGIR